MLTGLAGMEGAVRGSAAPAEEVLRTAVRAGEPAVRATRGQNPMNRAAGVVDAGARGLWLLFDGALAALDGHADVQGAVPIVAPTVVTASLVTPLVVKGPLVARPAVSAPLVATAESVGGRVRRQPRGPTRPLDAVREEMPSTGRTACSWSATRRS